MGKLVRCINKEGTIVIMAVDSTDVVAEAERIHKTSAVVTAALGRLLTGCSMMGAMLKGKDDSVSLQFRGNGPAGSLIAVSDSEGNVRGSVDNPVVELALNDKGKLDVGGAVGREGTMFVVKDLGLKEPYVGQTPIVSGEIAEDITSYYAVSEQIPTVCALGVLVNPDLTAKAAGGFMIQLLPAADEREIELVERCIAGLPSVTSMIDKGMSPEDICRFVLKECELEVLDESKVSYKCNCTRERVERALMSVGKETLEELAAEGKEQELCCHFCDKKYYFSSDDIKKMIAES